MAVDSMKAAKAYAQALQTIRQDISPAASREVDQSAFASLLNQGVQQIEEAAKSASNTITQSALGQADLVDVATSIAAAEIALETVIAVRDEAIKAYQEVMRMPI